MLSAFVSQPLSSVFGMASEMTPDHVVGLVVGEGCFYVESAPDPKYRLGWRLRPGFCIEMRIDELPLLEAVRDVIGCGRIYELDFGRYRGYERKGWVPHAKYRVGSIKELEQFVVPFFEAHPLFGRKAIAFGHFSRLIALLAAGEHRSPAGLHRGKVLAAKLCRHNRRGQISLRTK